VTETDFDLDGQLWKVAWHPGPVAPGGKNHGALAVCVTADREVVLVSDGVGWSLPGGRPEAGEGWRATMEREVLEEACAAVVSARLLGFTRGRCVEGHEQGLVLVRSAWRADVELGEWEPQHETVARRLVAPDDVLRWTTDDGSSLPLYEEILQAAFD